MIIFNKTVLSKEAPNIKDALWAKPTDNGFQLYALYDSKWQQLKCADDKVEPQIDNSQAIKQELVGSVQDKTNALTLWGLKNYVDSMLASLVQGEGED